MHFEPSLKEMSKQICYRNYVFREQSDASLMLVFPLWFICVYFIDSEHEMYVCHSQGADNNKYRGRHEYHDSILWFFFMLHLVISLHTQNHVGIIMLLILIFCVECLALQLKGSRM